MKNIENYFLEELAKLNDLSKEFVAKHPSVANMLVSSSTDPDVERLLEGVAFLDAFLKREIDESYIKIAKYLLEHTFPDILKPMASSTILHITPNEYLKEKIKIRKGTYFLASENAEDYRFQNFWDIDVYPLHYSVKKDKNKLYLHVKSSVDIGKICFFINTSQDKKFVLFKYLYESKVYKKTANKTQNISVSFRGFEDNGYKTDEFYNPFSILQEYFNFIEKFFIFELELNEKECEIIFESDKNLPFDINDDELLPYCVPAVNIFEVDLDPIELDYTQECIILDDYSKYPIYDIKEVIGYRGNRKIHYHKFKGHGDFEHSYEIYEKRILDEQKKCLLIHFNSTKVDKEILSIRAWAMNKDTDILKVGSINKASDNTPELITFSNITEVTSQNIKIKEESIWDFMSVLNLTLTSIKNSESLKNILKLFVNENSKNKNLVYKNIKKIESISGFSVKSANKIYKGRIIKGLEVNIKINGEYFINIEEVFLFGLVLEYFFASFVHVNNFIVLKIKEETSGNELICKDITGSKKLI